MSQNRKATPVPKSYASVTTVASKKLPKDRDDIISRIPRKICIGDDILTESVNQNQNKTQTSTAPMTKHKIQVKGVVNVKKQELVKHGYDDFMDWSSNKDNLYIGRDMSHHVPGAVGSVWGNPFPVAKPEKFQTNAHRNNTPRYTLDESLILFRQHIESSPNLISRLKELDGKALGCWCKPNRCHGDILTELVEKYCN